MSDKRFYLGQPSGSLRDTKNNDERVRHVDLMNEFHARLTALERAGENMGTKFGPDESLHCHVCGQAEVTCNCDRPSPALPEMEIREFLTPKPKVVNVRLETPTAATVERYTEYRFVETPLPDAFERDQIGEVVATRDNNGWWRLCFEPNKWSSVYSQEQYEWIVDHNTKSGIWERQG